MPDHRWIRPGASAHNGETIWVRAIWLGRSEITDEDLAGTASSLVRSRTIRRLLASSRADPALLESALCPPSDTGRGGAVKRGRPPKAQPAAFTPGQVQAEPADGEGPTAAEEPPLSSSFEPMDEAPEDSGGAASSSAPLGVPLGPPPMTQSGPTPSTPPGAAPQPSRSPERKRTTTSTDAETDRRALQPQLCTSPSGP